MYTNILVYFAWLNSKFILSKNSLNSVVVLLQEIVCRSLMIGNVVDHAFLYIVVTIPKTTYSKNEVTAKSLAFPNLFFLMIELLLEGIAIFDLSIVPVLVFIYII